MKEKPIYYVLMRKANSDLKVAKRELLYEEPELEIICFHLQQFVEKYLKSFFFLVVKNQKKYII